MKVELLFFQGCPHVEAAREQLRVALGQLGLPLQWDELDVQSPATPEELRPYGSPTILIDGADVVPAGKTDGVACRLYLGTDRPGAPPLTTLLSALRARSSSGGPR